MSLRSSALAALCLALSLTIGCGGEPPEKEMQQAQGALDAARAAGADVYATDEYGAAQTALTHARASSGMCRRSHVRAWRCAVSDATTQ